MQSAPDAPTLANATTVSITLNEMPGCEYSIVDMAWQTSVVFNNLTPSTSYLLVARKAETATHLASDPSVTAQFTTETDTVGINKNELINVQIYGHQNTIYLRNIEADNFPSLQVEIMDMMGRLVYQSLSIQFHNQ